MNSGLIYLNRQIYERGPFMKLVTFDFQGNTGIGALQIRDGNETIVDFKRAKPELATDMIELLKGGPAALQLAEEALISASSTAILAAIRGYAKGSDSAPR